MDDVMSQSWSGDAISQDAFYGGQVTVFQPRQGFRAGTDSVLLAASLPSQSCGTALEIGCGAGGALLPAAWRLAHLHFTGLEQDTRYAALAQRGVEANGFSGRVEIHTGQAQALPTDWQNRFDLVFSNPPFFDAQQTQAPKLAKHGAYVESIPLKAWLRAMLFALRPKGTLILIHRASELARLLTYLDRQSGEICICPIHAYPGAAAKRVLIRARKGLRPGALRMLEPLYLYTSPGGERTDQALEMQQNGAGLSW